MLMRHLGPGCPLTSSQENKMDVWLSGQAVARLTELLAVVAAAPGTSDQHRCQLYSCSSQVEELMPASELLALAGVLREATDRPGLSAAVRTDCWLSARPRPPPPTRRLRRRAPLGTPCWFQALIAARLKPVRAGSDTPPSSCGDRCCPGPTRFRRIRGGSVASGRRLACRRLYELHRVYGGWCPWFAESFNWILMPRWLRSRTLSARLVSVQEANCTPRQLHLPWPTTIPAKPQLGMHPACPGGIARALVDLADQVGEPGVADRAGRRRPRQPGVLA